MIFRCVFMIFLIGICFDLLGQVNSYGVHIDDNRVGRYSISTEEVGDSFFTFTSLRTKIKTLEDTTYFRQDILFTENKDGHLTSVNTHWVLTDTLFFHALFNPDRALFSNSSDTLIFRDSTILGPEGIKILCKTVLDSIRAKVCYPTFIAEIKSIKQVTREVISVIIEKAQKYWIVQESMDNQILSTGKYDTDFNFIEMSSPSAFGEIKLKEMITLDTLEQIFPSELYSHRVRSNTFLPDPKNINGVELFVQTNDTIHHFTLTDNSFKPVLKDSSLQRDYLSIINWVGFSNSDSVNRVVKSIQYQRDTPISKIKKLYDLSKSYSKNSRFNNIKLLQLVRQIGIPASLVHGYVYQYGYWESHLWIEAAIDDEWLPFDTADEFDINRALRIPLKSSLAQNEWADFNSSVFPSSDSASIVITEFLRKNRLHKLKRAGHDPIEIKAGRYTNHVLGIGFDLPNNYKLVNSRLGEVVTMQNQWKEKVSLEQIIFNSENPDSLMVNALIDYTLGTDQNMRTDKKNDLQWLVNLDRAAIVFSQGQSYYILKIRSEYAEDMVDFFVQRNLIINF